jgi:hypothetical protein
MTRDATSASRFFLFPDEKKQQFFTHLIKKYYFCILKIKEVQARRTRARIAMRPTQLNN